MESASEDDCDLALPDSSDDDDDTADVTSRTAKKRKKKKTRKIIAIESFLNMSDEGVLAATTFDHYYGESASDFIKWTILKDGDEISEDVMEHPSQETSPFSVEIPWSPETSKVDYFDIFFKHFFPSLEGKAAVLDKYLSNPRCSGHSKYWVNENVRFHRPDHPNPDYIVSFIFLRVIQCIFVLILLLLYTVDDLRDARDCSKSRS